MAGIAQGVRTNKKRKAETQLEPEIEGTRDGSLWACPFFLYAKEKHWNCRVYQMHRVGDVRGHIKRCHMEAPVHCPTCWRTFEGKDRNQERIQHVLTRGCQPTEAPDSWVTEGQFSRMKGQSTGTTGTPEELRWYKIWEVAFPTTTYRPSSPYYHGSDRIEFMRYIVSLFLESDSFYNLTSQVIASQFCSLDREKTQADLRRVLAELVKYCHQRDATWGIGPPDTSQEEPVPALVALSQQQGEIFTASPPTLFDGQDTLQHPQQLPALPPGPHPADQLLWIDEHSNDLFPGLHSLSDDNDSLVWLPTTDLSYYSFQGHDLGA
ncbi:hypothetical protein B0H63DRAFT_522711 [Podospora didyma]|uniref:C2H2-type domain-containing protein n=1 Tax=Podospora didyma TaxID=330526 RepID=A0AAE0TZP3_9PEZI|nr:hypothetical protein B0H63DRAFT_522711 [Podospora didyma]